MSENQTIKMDFDISNVDADNQGTEMVFEANQPAKRQKINDEVSAKAVTENQILLFRNYDLNLAVPPNIHARDPNLKTYTSPAVKDWIVENFNPFVASALTTKDGSGVPIVDIQNTDDFFKEIHLPSGFVSIYVNSRFQILFFLIYSWLELKGYVTRRALDAPMDLLLIGDETQADLDAVVEHGEPASFQTVLKVAKAMEGYFDWSFTNVDIYGDSMDLPLEERRQMGEVEKGYKDLHPMRMWLATILVRSSTTLDLEEVFDRIRYTGLLEKKERNWEWQTKMMIDFPKGVEWRDEKANIPVRQSYSVQMQQAPCFFWLPRGMRKVGGVECGDTVFWKKINYFEELFCKFFGMPEDDFRAWQEVDGFESEYDSELEEAEESDDETMGGVCMKDAENNTIDSFEEVTFGQDRKRKRSREDEF
ncbi:hypothetical protein EG329_003081 [Mollisiaceae sp. DMI_Dod_QoI]|nr:hypothetical protein EG329_003081 [Helotiales sp. DMI_Dod_QoI]